MLLFYSHADDLIKGSFKNAALTLYAIGFALAITPAHHSSVQTDIVLHSFISVLLFSIFALMSCCTFLRTRLHYLTLAGAFPIEIWLLVLAVKEVRDNHCDEFLFVKKRDHWGMPLYEGFWAGSIALYIVITPIFSLLWFQRPRSILQKGMLKLIPIVLWFLVWFFMVVACEIATNSFSFKEPESYQHTYLSVGIQEWGFGQVMAVVVLFLQLWDILSYPLQPSPYGGK